MLPQGRTSSTNTTNPPSFSTRSSSSDTQWKSCNHHDQQLLFQKLASMGYTNPNVCKGMIKALESIYGVGNVNEATLSKFGSSALQMLSESVEREQKSSKLTFVGIVHFVVKHHNFSFDLPCKEGESLMMLAKSPLGHDLLAEYLECACGGRFAFLLFQLSDNILLPFNWVWFVLSCYFLLPCITLRKYVMCYLPRYFRSRYL
jgi:hypothetical protein